MKKYKTPKILVEPPGPKTRKIIDKITQSIEVPVIWRRRAEVEVVPKYAEGVWIEDADGNVYLDFISTHTLTNTGHRHPKVVEACKRQLDKVMLGKHEVTLKHLKLLKKLAEMTPGSFEKRIHLSTSAGASNDIAIRLARWSTRRPYIISFIGGYYGTTYGSLSLTSLGPHYRRGQSPLVPGIVDVPYPYCYRCPFKLEHPECGVQCLSYIEDYAFKTFLPAEDVAAINIEPIQGDAGWIVPPEGYLPRLKRICEDHGILFIAEEVQTGLGRTGKMFACEHWGIEPDMMVLGKALASGMPISACVAKAEIADPEGRETPFISIFSFTSSVVCFAAALATLEIIEEERLAENAARVGEYMIKRLVDMKNHKIVGDVRGKGLLIGVEIVKDKERKEPGAKEAQHICDRAFKKGLLLIPGGIYGSVLRIAPPLIITKEQAEIGLNIIEEVISEVETNA